MELLLVIAAGLGLASWLSKPESVVRLVISLVLLAGMLYGIVSWSSGQPAADRLVNGVRKQVDGWVDQANDSLEREAPKR